MYIYFGKSGNLSTAVYYNGEPIRQENPFDVYVCFPCEEKYADIPIDGGITLRWDAAAGADSADFITAGEADESCWGEARFFAPKGTSGRSFGGGGFDLAPGRKYYMYLLRVPADSGVTANYGHVRFIVEAKLGDDSVRQGAGSVNVLKTIGDAYLL